MTRLSRIATRLTTCAAFLLLAGTAAPALAQTPSVTATDPWVREPMGQAQQTAIFLVLENHSGTARELVSASTPVAGKTELHTMSMEGGMMRMSPVKSVAIPANGKAELKPGSFHIMLFELKSHPADGATVPVTLTFDNGEKLDVKATVRKPEGMR